MSTTGRFVDPNVNQACPHRTKHRHGTRVCYVTDRCRCDDCRRANTAANRYLRTAKLYGRYDDLVDAEPVREHLRALMAQGMGWRAIATAAGLPRSTVRSVLWGAYEPGHPDYRPPRKQVRKETAEALIAVELEFAPGASVDATGTRRRLEALQVQGWSLAEIAARIGWIESNLPTLMRQTRVLKRTHDTVAAAFERMSRQAPTNQQPGRVSKLALDRGFAPAAAFDDLDDPTETPSGIPGRDYKPRTCVDYDADVYWRLELGESVASIAADLRVDPETLEATLRRRADRWASAS